MNVSSTEDRYLMKPKMSNKIHGTFGR